MRDYCLNCSQARTSDLPYCAECGQSYEEANLNFWAIVRDFFTNTFALDSRLLQTMRWLPIPAKLSIEYVGGHRVGLVKPGRLFFIALVLHVAAWSYLANVTLIKDVEDSSGNIVRSAEHRRMLTVYDSLWLHMDSTLADDACVLESMRAQLFAGQLAPDSSGIALGDFKLVTAALSEYQITDADLARLDADFLIDKYEITDFWGQLQVRQAIRVNVDLAGTIRSTISNIFWVIVIMVFLTAIFLKVLYIRHQVFFTEHLVLSTHTHTLLLAVASVCIVAVAASYRSSADAGGDVVFFVEEYLWLYLAGMFVFTLIALRRYYQQHWSISVLKMSLLTIAYAIAAIFVFILILVFTLAVF